MKSEMVVVLGIVSTFCVAFGIRIGAFNVQDFGHKKVGNRKVMDILATIAKRYDILSIEELHENPKYHLPLETLANLTNSKFGARFQTIKSEALGPSRFKENYGFMFRDSISVINSATFEGGSGKLFERDPFLVQFQANGMKFVLGSIHTRPNVTVTPVEISRLAKVFDEAERKFQTDNIIILGDLNAGRHYVKNWTNVPIKHDPSVHWLINDTVDTTVRGLGQAYDRILLKGEQLYAQFVKGSNGTFNFVEQLRLDRTMALNVSDHLPVELELS